MKLAMNIADEHELYAYDAYIIACASLDFSRSLEKRPFFLV